MKDGRDRIVLISEDDILTINEALGYKCIDEGKVRFLISKIKSMKTPRDKKKALSKIAAQLWYYLILDHPFLDGNKRTASEAMLLFLELNKAKLNIPLNGMIYVSLKIANSDITLKELEDIIYEKLEVDES